MRERERFECQKMSRRRVRLLERPGGVVIEQIYIDENTTIAGIIKQISSILSARINTVSVVRGSGTCVINSTRDIADGDMLVCASTSRSLRQTKHRNKKNNSFFPPGCCGKFR